MNTLSELVKKAVMLSAVAEAIFDNVPIVIADLHSGEIVYVTKPVEELFGYLVHGELIGRNVDELVPPDALHAHQAGRALWAANPRLLRPRGSNGKTLQGMRKDGSVFNADIILSPCVVASQLCAVAMVIPTLDENGNV